jgi:hypothetical protein
MPEWEEPRAQGPAEPSEVVSMLTTWRAGERGRPTEPSKTC